MSQRRTHDGSSFKDSCISTDPKGSRTDLRWLKDGEREALFYMRELSTQVSQICVIFKILESMGRWQINFYFNIIWNQ